jgi:hypothetical protein
MNLLTPAQVAGKIGRTVRQVQRYAKAGLFPGAVQVGRSWGIPPSALVGFVPPEPGNPNMGPGFWTRRRRKALSRRKKKLS